ncbi:MAG: HNH endonuclease [Janthinobacterium lividum]
MSYHVFNIGRPATTDWWRQNLERRVITAGFAGTIGDRGDEILHDMQEGDWVIAYCIGHGFVGAGVVGPESSYGLHGTVPVGSLSDHRHERSVNWTHTVFDVDRAVSIEEAGRHAPRHTKELERNEVIAKGIVALLAARAGEQENAVADSFAKTAKYWHVVEAVRAIGRPCSIREVQDWLESNYPTENSSDARENATLLTVNDANRRHYDRGRASFRTDRGNEKDALYREGHAKNVTYTFYWVDQHGVWDIAQDSQGNARAIQVPASPLQSALVDARRLAIEELRQPIFSDHDGRVRELRALVLREGQCEFRSNLLNAYANRCAMTGCTVIEILEAAHIKPYRGEDTNRVDNGLILRADIHTLFDKGLIWLDDDLVIRLSERLLSSEYEELEGTQLRLPVEPSHRPHPEHVRHHRQSIFGKNDA